MNTGTQHNRIHLADQFVMHFGYNVNTTGSKHNTDQQQWKQRNSVNNSKNRQHQKAKTTNIYPKPIASRFHGNTFRNVTGKSVSLESQNKPTQIAPKKRNCPRRWWCQSGIHENSASNGFCPFVGIWVSFRFVRRKNITLVFVLLSECDTISWLFFFFCAIEFHIVLRSHYCNLCSFFFIIFVLYTAQLLLFAGRLCSVVVLWRPFESVSLYVSIIVSNCDCCGSIFLLFVWLEFVYTIRFRWCSSSLKVKIIKKKPTLQQ